jgi:predicted aspartyl protease
MKSIIAATALIAGLVATASAEQCKPLQRYGQVAFQTDETAHIYLPATLGGFQTRLMLDTGAYWSLVRNELVTQLNLPTKTNYNLVLFDGGGNKIDKSVVIPNFTLGQLKFGAAEFFVSGLFAGSPLTERAGVVGQNVFTQVDLEIDNAGKTISIFSQDHCPGDGVYWADEAVVLKYDREGARRMKVASRIKRGIDKNQIDEPIVSAELQGQPITVLFDTGATKTSMDIEFARRVFNITPQTPGMEPAGQVMVGTGARIDTWRYTFKELVISGIRFENVPVLLGDFKDRAGVILGMNEMKHLRLYFAFREGAIYVTAADAGRPQAPK